MEDQPLYTDSLELAAMEKRAAYVLEHAPAEWRHRFDMLCGGDVPRLVAEVNRLRRAMDLMEWHEDISVEQAYELAAPPAPPRPGEHDA